MRHVPVVFVLVLTVLIRPVCSYAENTSYLIRPVVPQKYPCASFRKDLTRDKDAAISKAMSIIGDTLNYISDETVFDLYVNKFKDATNGLAMALEFHRGLIKDSYWIMKMISEDMEAKGEVVFFQSFCDLRKDTEIGEIATAYSMAVTQLKNK